MLLLLLIYHAGALAQTAPEADSGAGRFTGSAGLTKPAPASDDARFVLRAALGANTAPASAYGERFVVKARLQPDSKALLGTACGPRAEDIFRNGFE
jgi:hypothetical protein